MFITFRHKFTLFVATILLALPLNLFSQILERDGITIEVSDNQYLSEKKRKKFKMRPISIEIINQTNSMLTLNTKSILHKNAAKDPMLVNKYDLAKSMSCNMPLYLYCLGIYTFCSILNDVDPRIDKWIAYIGAMGGCFGGLYAKEYLLLLSFNILEKQEFMYRPYTEGYYFFWGLYRKECPWEVTIDPSKSKGIIVLLDETCKKFTFDVYKNSDNSKPERIRFMIELEDNVAVPSQV